MQQASNYTLKSDIDYLFKSCASLGAWWYSTNKAHKHQNFYFYIVHRLYISAKELVSIGYKLHSSLIN